MHLTGRFIGLALSACGLLITLTACAATGGQAVNQPGEFTGKIVGPLEFGQPGEGAGLKAYGLELAAPLKLDDKAECGEQTASVLAVESASVAAHVGKTVVLRATPYCRVSRSGKYHLKDVSVR
ncbi:MAG: hypothetical protein IV088_00605 [Hydrogenophaga sp.]|uniref:hypothetical protein n=1 Tax=Hydrogenophaga sp. TaxID=1904254 RepID=UPI0025C17B03|nr:hypothetical protein [Hydrogenophaga sp.]MBT9549320.1 hypothetical protein [Hydrogenophaga sp.]